MVKRWLDIYLVVSLTFFLILLCEGSAQLFYFLRPIVKAQLTPQKEVSGANKPVLNLRGRWEPYLYWKPLAIKSEMFNIDGQGIRETKNAILTGKKTRKVFVLGGSTIWGSGVSDGETVPSFLSERLVESGWGSFEVINLGQSGYVSTQELIALMLELRKGNVPDFVISYGGGNDIFATYQNKKAGVTHMEQKLSNLYEGRHHVAPPFWETVLEHSALVKISQAIGRRLSTSHPPMKKIKRLVFSQPDESKAQIDKRIEQTLNLYLNNIKTLHALGRAYGFNTYAFWQPTLFSRKSLAPIEILIHEGESRKYGETLESYFETANRQFTRKASPNVHNLTALFDEASGFIYWDFMHVYAKGNRLIAEAIFDVMRQDLKKLKSIT